MSVMLLQPFRNGLPGRAAGLCKHPCGRGDSHTRVRITWRRGEINLLGLISDASHTRGLTFYGCGWAANEAFRSECV
jgi:hypothetical protein